MLDIKENSKSENMWCRTCFLFQESQSHILKCSPIAIRLKAAIDFKTIDYIMIIGSLDDQIKMAKIYTLIMKARSDIIDKRSSSC